MDTDRVEPGTRRLDEYDVEAAIADDAGEAPASDETPMPEREAPAPESLTPEELEDELEGRAAAPEERATHEPDMLVEAVLDEGPELRGWPDDEMEWEIEAHEGEER